MPDYLSPERTQRLADLRRKYHRLAPYVEYGIDRIHVASVATCMRLFDVSDWRGTYWQWSGTRERGRMYEPAITEYRLEEIQYDSFCFVPSEEDRQREWIADYPAYDLSYQLRKFASHGGIELHYGDQGCTALWQLRDASAETPEEAVGLLAIKLFELGIFEKEEQE